MASRRFGKKTRRVRNKSNKRGKSKSKSRSGRQWITAVGAAEETLRRTGSYDKARQTLRNQALSNARRLFGAVGERM